MHDVNVLDLLLIEAGAFYIMDRGYLDFERLYALDQAGGETSCCGRRANRNQPRISHATESIRVAGSSDRCNTSIKSFGRGCKSQSLARPFVKLPSHSVELCLRVHRQVGPLWKILPQ